MESRRVTAPCNYPAVTRRLNGGELWRDADFVKFWLAYSTATFGTLMDALTLAAIVILEARPSQMAALVVARTAPGLLFGLVAGAWVDRLQRRPVLVAADLGRALTMGSIPLAHFGFVLHIEHIYAVAFINGTLTIFFNVAHPSYVPGLVGQQRIFDANSKITATNSIMEAVAFAVSGWIAQLVSAVAAAVTQATTFLVSSVLLLSIRHAEAAPPPSDQRSSLRSEITGGLRFLWNHALLRSVFLSATLIGVSDGVFGSMVTLFAINTIGFGPGVVGSIYAIGGVSAFVGALVARRATRRFGLGRSMALSILWVGFVTLLIPLAHGPLWIASIFFIVPQLLGDGVWTIHEISELSLRQAVTPDAMRGRVNSAFSVGTLTAALLGAVVAGAIAESIGIRWSLVFGTGELSVAGLVLASSPVWKIASVPEG